PAFKTQWEMSLDAPTFDLRHSVTTPVAYISQYPLDVFYPEDESRRLGLAYFTNGVGWFLVSTGPDMDYDTPFRLLAPDMTYIQTRADGTPITLRGAKAAQASLMPYHVTNGTYSNGDIYHFADVGADLSWIDYRPSVDSP
ncbi:MAG: hypothetical protein ACOC2L_00705, partial [Candidatus Sumerlaeota bacterium]